jgi:multisubunit Na+/H+ antiporter MnhG subunit
MNRHLALALGMVVMFAAAVGVLLAVMPAPHKPTDYLVMGAVGTLLCMLLLFVVLINAAVKPAVRKDDPDTVESSERAPDAASSKKILNL